MPSHPAPAATTTDVHRASARGGRWMLAGQAIRLAVGIASLMVLARLLGPQAFGVFAMAQVVAAVVLSVGGFGFHLAVVQRPTLSEPAVRRLFRVNLALSAALLAVVCGTGPLLAWFFDEPRVAGLAAALSVGVFLDNAVALHWGRAQRAMRFGRLAVADTAAVVAGAAAGIAAAWAGAGVWALAAQQIVTLGLRAALIVRAGGRRPNDDTAAAPADDPAYRAMLRYGGQHTLGRVVKEVASRIDRIVIGRLAGAEALGLYANAARWAALPQQQLLSPLTTVATAGASRLQQQPDAYRRYVRRAAGVSFAATLPALAFLAAAPGPVVDLLLGPGWDGAKPLLALLALGLAGATPLLTLKTVLYAEGRLDAALRINLVAAALQVAGVLLGAACAGVLGVAAGYALARTAASAFLVPHGLRGSAVSVCDYLTAAATPLAAAAVAGGVVHVLPPAVFPPAVLPALLAHAAAFTAVWAAVTLALPAGRSDLRWAWQQMRR